MTKKKTPRSVNASYDPDMYLKSHKNVFKGLKTEFVWLTPKLAKEFMARNISKNRTMNPKRLDIIEGDMVGGLWGFNGDSLRFNIPKDMIDGQYRCQAVINTGITIPVMVQTGLSKEAFDMLDCLGKSRTFGETLKTKKFQNVDVLNKTLKMVISLREDFKPGNDRFPDVHHQETSPAVKLKTIMSEKNLSNIVDLVCYKDKNTNTKKDIEEAAPAYMVAAFYHVFNKIDAEKAKTFKEGMPLGFTPPNSPSGKMRKYLAALEVQRLLKPELKLTGRKLLYKQMYAIIVAWNAEMKGVPLNPKALELDLENGKVKENLMPMTEIVGSEKYLEWLKANVKGF